MKYKGGIMSLLWGQIRTLRDSIRADEEQLENAPLGPIQKKRLANSIAKQKAELKEVLKKNRELIAEQKTL